MSLILCIKADAPEVYVGLWHDTKEKSSKQWLAGRELSGQLLEVIESLCRENSSSISDIAGIIVYSGPGSYTGLRISVSVVNSIGYSYEIPIIGTSGDSWIHSGLEKMDSTTAFVPITPVYGSEAYTTKPKK